MILSSNYSAKKISQNTITFSFIDNFCQSDIEYLNQLYQFLV